MSGPGATPAIWVIAQSGFDNPGVVRCVSPGFGDLCRDPFHAAAQD